MECLEKTRGKQVKAVFEGHFGVNLIYIDASNLFLNKLQNISDPEQKKEDNRSNIY